MKIASLGEKKHKLMGDIAFSWRKKTQTWELKLPSHGDLKGASLVTLHLKSIPITTIY